MTDKPDPHKLGQMATALLFRIGAPLPTEVRAAFLAVNPICECGHPFCWHVHAAPGHRTYCASEGECFGCEYFRPAVWSRYGKPLTPLDGRDNLQDALEEALDLAGYLAKEQLERKALDAEIERLRGWQREAEELIGHQLREIRRLEALNQRLRESGFVEAEKSERLRAALEQYADFHNWVGAAGPFGELSGWVGSGKGWALAQEALDAQKP